MSFNQLVQLNIGYDSLARCTSIVVRKPFLSLFTSLLSLLLLSYCQHVKVEDEGGIPYHLRNMDWDMDLLRDAVINVEFWKRGVKICTAATFLGFVGFYTAMRENQFSVALNFRKSGWLELVMPLSM